MTPDELHDWILDDGIAPDLQRVIQLTVLSELDNLEPDATIDLMPEDIDWRRLILAGSILAKSDHRHHQEAALRIATGAMTLSEEVSIRDAAAVLMSKMGNHRAVHLGEQRDQVDVDLNTRLGVSLRLETQRRELNNSILIGSTGEQLQVNGFQHEFWEGATQDATWLSTSAPTASGKTYLVSKWLIDELETGQAKVAVYLAPTRALVSEVEASLEDALKGHGTTTIEVTSLPLAGKFHEIISSKKAVIFVFTQERLHLLANALEEHFAVDLLVVDEAHKIGDNQRGVVLQDAVERLSRVNPKLKAVFISPATENPEELLADAPSEVAKKSRLRAMFPRSYRMSFLLSKRGLKPKNGSLVYAMELKCWTSAF